ncbi:MAG TPA: PH domain-containing protein [Gammaproteobacteria bacterium]
MNRQVDVATLPRFDAVRLEKPSPAYRRLVSIIVGLVAAPVLIAAILFAAAAHGVTLPVRLLVLLLVVAVLAGVAAIVHAHVRCIGYAVREHDVILRSGIFFKAESVQPLKRIQHVEQVQGPLDKRFGLWTLKLYSAGTGRATFSIPGLEADTANAIRRFVLSFHEPAAPAASPPETSVPADG